MVHIYGFIAPFSFVNKLMGSHFSAGGGDLVRATDKTSIMGDWLRWGWS